MSVKLDKTSGGSNSISTETVTVSRRSVHYGRISTPQTTWRVTADGASATMIVTEEAYGLWISSVGSSHSIHNSATSFVLNCGTNAYGIRVTFSENNINARIDGVYADSVTQTHSNGYAFISGDPGANDRFNLMLTFRCDVNKTISARTAKITLAFYASSSDTSPETQEVTVTQAAGNAYVYWSTTSGQETTAGSATMTQAGTAITTYVMSNTTWTISQV